MVSVNLFACEDDPPSSGRNGTTHVTLQIEDTGIGMSSGFVSNDMFGKFFDRHPFDLIRDLLTISQYVTPSFLSPLLSSCGNKPRRYSFRVAVEHLTRSRWDSTNLSDPLTV